jgi:sigma-B regulation protein RsbU (phosphoserine phosphatase)
MTADRRTASLQILRFFFRLSSPTFLFLSFSFSVDDVGRTWIMWRDATPLALTLACLSLLMAAGWFTTAFLLRPRPEGLTKGLPSVREAISHPYNIWGPMALASRVGLAVAVFLIFGTIGPLLALMAGPDELLRPIQVVILALGSGGISASIVLFGHRRLLLAAALAVCMAVNISSDELTSLLIGRPKIAPSPGDGSVHLTQRQLGDIRDQRMLVSIGGILLLSCGYVSFIVLLAREGRKRARLQAEMAIARRIQESLIPEAAFHTSWCDAAGLTVPASEVGGDYYDFVELSGTQVALFVADVAGHGVGAGIMGAMTKSAFRSHMTHDPSPGALLGLLNATVCQMIERNTFVTAAYVLLDHVARRARVATAGHPAVIRLSSSGEIEEIRSRSVGLGMDRKAVYTESALSCQGGDTIILYTDGVLEASNGGGEQFGEERLKDLLMASRNLTSEALCAAVMRKVREFSAPGGLSDDATFVALRLRPGA